MTAEIETTDDAAEALAPAATSQADAACDGIIWNHAAYAAVAGLVPIPAVDLAAASAVQVRMVAQLCEARGVAFSEQAVKTVIATLIAAGLPRGVLGYPAISAAKAVPVVGTLLAVATLPALNGAVTWAVGRVFNWHFARGGTIETLDPAALSSRFASEVERGKSAVKSAVRRRGASSADDAEVLKTEAG